MRCTSLRDLIRTLYDLLEWKVVEEKVAKKKLNNISMIRTFDLLTTRRVLYCWPFVKALKVQKMTSTEK